MENITTNKENAKAIVLNDDDNILVALDNMNAGQYLKQFSLTIDAPILSQVKKLQKLISQQILQYTNTEQL